MDYLGKLLQTDGSSCVNGTGYMRRSERRYTFMNVECLRLPGMIGKRR